MSYANELPRTVTCASCGAVAALSIAGQEQRCESCGQPLVLPLEVRALLRTVEQLVGGKLALASTLDAASGRVSAHESTTLLFVVVLVLLFCSGLEGLSSLGAVRSSGDITALIPAAGGILAAFGFATTALLLHRIVRRRLRRLFTAYPPEPGAPRGSCHACGGPLPEFRGGSVRCVYCRCDNLIGRRGAIQQVAGLQQRLVAHADDMLRAMHRVSILTRVLGFGTLVLLPVVSGGVWWLLMELLELLQTT